MTATHADLPKPIPASRNDPLSVQIVTRLTPVSREAIKAVAEAEGITIQQMGLYAWSLAMKAYGTSALHESV
jgi:hypothetical protein